MPEFIESPGARKLQQLGIGAEQASSLGPLVASGKATPERAGDPGTVEPLESSDPVVITDLQNRIVRGNAAASALFGDLLSRSVGRPLGDVVRFATAGPSFEASLSEDARVEVQASAVPFTESGREWLIWKLQTPGLGQSKRSEGFKWSSDGKQRWRIDRGTDQKRRRPTRALPPSKWSRETTLERMEDQLHRSIVPRLTTLMTQIETANLLLSEDASETTLRRKRLLLETIQSAGGEIKVLTKRFQGLRGLRQPVSQRQRWLNIDDAIDLAESIVSREVGVNLPLFVKNSLAGRIQVRTEDVKLIQTLAWLLQQFSTEVDRSLDRYPIEVTAIENGLQVAVGLPVDKRLRLASSSVVQNTSAPASHRSELQSGTFDNIRWERRAIGDQVTVISVILPCDVREQDS